MRAMKHHFYLECPKLFCSWFKPMVQMVQTNRLKRAFYGTSKFVLTLYFCEPLLIIVQENKSMRNIKE